MQRVCDECGGTIPSDEESVHVAADPTPGKYWAPWDFHERCQDAAAAVRRLFDGGAVRVTVERRKW